jgi:hypothetical protein
LTVVLRASTAQLGDGVNPVTVTKPTGTVDGDVVLVLGSTDQPGNTMSTPAGWTALTVSVSETGGTKLAGFWKIAASEGASWSFTRTVAAASVLYHALTFTNINSGAPLTAPTYTAGNTTSTSHIAPSVTPTIADSYLVCWFACQGASRTYLPPAGMAEAQDNTDTFLTMESATLLLSSTSATGTKTATASTTDTYIAGSVLVQGGGSVTIAKDHIVNRARFRTSLW